jgi:S-DNA-T family DNA segregation ATPase FtsK/SpoIIIE
MSYRLDRLRPAFPLYLLDVMPRSANYTHNANLLMDRMIDQIKRRAWRALGAVLMGGAIGLLLACLTYSPHDPSLNTATQVPAGNWVFGIGALWADFFLQNIGLGVLPLVVFLFITGRALWVEEPATQSPWLAALYLMAALFAAAMAGARLPSFGFVPQPYLGGAIGMLALNSLAGMTQGTVGPWVHSMIALVMAVVSFVFTCLAAGVTVRGAVARLVAALLFFYDQTAFFATWAVHHFQKWRDPDGFAGGSLSGARRRRPVVTEDDSSGDNDDDDDDQGDDEAVNDTYRRRPANDIKVVRPAAARARKKTGPQQMELGDDKSDFELPAIDLLQMPPTPNEADKIDEGALRKNADMLQGVLGDYNVRGGIVSIHPGPVVTLYELEPAPGTKSSRVIGLANDIARSMSAVSVRAAVVPGRNAIGVEIPNKKRQTVYLRDLLTSEAISTSTAKLALVLGKDIGGHPVIADLARMPHLLVAGTTGSGKSVAINTMILSLLYRLTPAQCRFIMIDPKMLELSVYDDIPHLLSPVVTEPGKAIVALKWAVIEMENRYRAMSKLGVRNIEGYNARLNEARRTGEVLTRKVQTGFDPETGQPVYEEQPFDLTELPYIVIIVDEFADLMLVAGKDVESAIQRLAQMARAAGIHLIMATQRPSVDVITGVIKANFPTRISFQVTSKIDSRTILGDGGAEQLLGMGDMLYMAAGGRVVRVHGPFVSDGEVEQVVAHLKSQGSPEYLDEVLDETGAGTGLFGDGEGDTAGAATGSGVDDMYDQAVALVSREGKASTSFVQRHLQIGYNRAARIIEEMERQGVISQANAMGKREILVGDHSGRH